VTRQLCHQTIGCDPSRVEVGQVWENAGAGNYASKRSSSNPSPLIVVVEVGDLPDEVREFSNRDFSALVIDGPPDNEDYPVGRVVHHSENYLRCHFKRML
jgi:hypothetical protein